MAVELLKAQNNSEIVEEFNLSKKNQREREREREKLLPSKVGLSKQKKDTQKEYREPRRRDS